MMKFRIFLGVVIIFANTFKVYGGDSIPNGAFAGTIPGLATPVPIDSYYFTANNAAGLTFKPVPQQYWNKISQGVAGYIQAVMPGYPSAFQQPYIQPHQNAIQSGRASFACGKGAGDDTLYYTLNGQNYFWFAPTVGGQNGLPVVSGPVGQAGLSGLGASSCAS